MPEITRLSDRTTKICMYADDHPPPHFHLWNPNWEAKISLATLEVFDGYAPSPKLKEAVAWASQNMALLVQEWRRLNERDG